MEINKLTHAEMRRLIETYLTRRSPLDRYSSFDYCFNYFQGFYKNDEIAKIADEHHLESSVLQLAYYLASWGMFRGSTALLRHSSRCLIPVIELLARTPRETWKIDAPFYSNMFDDLARLYDEIGKTLSFPIIKAGKADPQKPSVILVTKIMLGVFGNTPAMDAFFCAGAKISLGTGDYAEVKKKVINVWKELAEIYTVHKETFDRFEINALPFDKHCIITTRYPVAKLMDMVYFQRGVELKREDKSVVKF